MSNNFHCFGCLTAVANISRCNRNCIVLSLYTFLVIADGQWKPSPGGQSKNMEMSHDCKGTHLTSDTNVTAARSAASANQCCNTGNTRLMLCAQAKSLQEPYMC